MTTSIPLQPEFPSQGRLVFLDNLRAVAIIMVVGIHALGYCLPLPARENAIIDFIVHLVAVPSFFLVDGYLFAHKIGRGQTVPYGKFIGSSAFRLLLPWAAFTLVYLVARGGFEWVGFLQEKNVVGRPLSFIAVAAYGSVYAGQLYFIFSLFLIRLAAPIWRGLSSWSIVAVSAVFLVYAVAYALGEPLLVSFLRVEGGQAPLLHALWGAQFYLFGIVLFRWSEKVALPRLLLPAVALFALGLLVSVLGYANNLLVQYLYLLVFFLFFVRYPFTHPWVALIGKNTMGIYLLHSPILLKFVSLVLNKFIHLPILNYFCLLTAVFFLSLGLALVLRTVPYGVVLFGEKYSAR